MKIEIWKKFWTIKDCNNNPNFLFIFGDNDVQKGKKGQAIIRYCKNSIGIPTKKYPSYNKNAYYYDIEYQQNIIKIDEAFNQIYQTIQQSKYDTIVIAKDGYGTGLANLKINAPKTLQYIDQKLKELIEYYENN